MSKRKPFGDFNQVVRFLKKKLPAQYKVSVRRKFLSGDTAADVGLENHKTKGKYFLIRIDKRLQNDAAILILLHEWAHVLTWTNDAEWLKGEEDWKKDHDRRWAIAYCKVYNTFYEEDE
jgi:hypothetical protein